MFSEDIRRAGLMDRKERQDGMLIAEAAMAECKFLASDDLPHVAIMHHVQALKLL